MIFLVKLVSIVKSVFTSKNIKFLIAIIILLLIGIIYYQNSKAAKLKAQIAVLTAQNNIFVNNTKVLAETAQKWKSKDSQNVITVGLLQASNQQWSTDFGDLNTKFNNLIKDADKKIQRQTYLETKIKVSDSIIAKIRADQGKQPKVPISISNDSTINIDQTNQYDSSNYHSTYGIMVVGIDNNKIKTAEINLSSKIGIGINLATYKDAAGISRVSVASRYPGLDLHVSGVTDLESEIQALKDKPKEKGSLGIGLTTGYGGIIGGSTTLQKGIFFGVGLVWMPNFLRFKK